jgi:hypothetical protein
MQYFIVGVLQTIGEPIAWDKTKSIIVFVDAYKLGKRGEFSK